MPSLINSDDGVVSGTAGLKTTGANDGILALQTNGSTAMTVNASQQVSFTNGANLPNTFGYKNRIINGGMRIDQRRNGAVFNNLVANEYTLDRWSCYGNVAARFSIQQSSVAPTGFNSSLLVTSLAATTPGTNDIYILRQYIEGFNIADFGWGTANAQTATVSFWVRSSLTGTFSGVIKNGIENRGYPFTYTINAANTWEQKSVVIPGDTTGTWGNGNDTGIQVLFSLGAGSGALTPPGAWAAGNIWAASGQTNIVGTNGATWNVTGVQFERGNAATSWDFRSSGTELALCQRYYEKSYDQSVVPGSASTSGYSAGNNSDQGSSVYIFNTDRFAVTKRATATMRVWDLAGNGGRTTQYTLGGLGRTDNANNIFTYTGAQSAAVMIFVVTASTASAYQWDASAEL